MASREVPIAQSVHERIPFEAGFGSYAQFYRLYHQQFGKAPAGRGANGAACVR